MSGPFKGLNIQLSGAFGGYFLLVLVVLGFVCTRPKPSKTQYEVWKVIGMTGFEQADSSLSKKNIRPSVRPPNLVINEDGSFKMDILVKPGQTGVVEFPVLVLEHPGHETASVDLDEKQHPFGKHYDKEYDKNAKKIIIKDRILLKNIETTAPYSTTNENP